MTINKMNEHIKLLGILYIVLGFVNFTKMFLVTGLIKGLTYILPISSIPFYSLINDVLFTFFGIFSIPLIVGGIALLNHKSWSRIFVLVLGFINIIHPILGTALGIYTLYVLFQEESKQVLDN